jgi:hypothetical protein
VLLYDKRERVLHFVEAKQLSDSRLVSKTRPEVIDQLERYRTQIQERQQEIVLQYCLYIENLNIVFNMNLPHPKKAEIEPVLWIFDFNAPEKEGILNSLKKDPNYNGIKVYAIGKAKDATPEKIINTGHW